MSNIQNAFDAIKKNKQQSNKTETGFKDIMKFEKNKLYEGRLLPYLPKPENTFFKYRDFIFTSAKTGKIISFISPNTFGKPCPAFELRQKLWKDENKKDYNRLQSGVKYLANLYVTKDPTEPENVGKVKLIRIPKTLWAIIEDHLDGKRSEDYGSKIIDPSPNGCNFQIDVKVKDKFQSYEQSCFTMPKELKGVDVDEILKQVIDPHSVFPVRTYEEIQNLLDVHFFGNEVDEEADEDSGVPSEEEYAKEKLAEINDKVDTALPDGKVITADDIDNLTI